MSGGIDLRHTRTKIHCYAWPDQDEHENLDRSEIHINCTDFGSNVQIRCCYTPGSDGLPRESQKASTDIFTDPPPHVVELVNGTIFHRNIRPLLDAIIEMPGHPELSAMIAEIVEKYT